MTTSEEESPRYSACRVGVQTGAPSATSRPDAPLSRHVLSLDWRGHGTSETPKGDFGVQELIRDALAVIESSGAPQIVPVALAHAGWVALDLCSELKERIPKLVFMNGL